MRVVPFEMWHADLLVAQGVQGEQLGEVSLVPVSYASLPRISGVAMTALSDSGRVLMCGGVVPRHPGVGEIWALVAGDCGRQLLALTRATRRFLETQRYRRIEGSCAQEFTCGARFFTLLGFAYEGLMLGYGANGEPHARFAFVRP